MQNATSTRPKGEEPPTIRDGGGDDDIIEAFRRMSVALLCPSPHPWVRGFGERIRLGSRAYVGSLLVECWDRAEARS